MNSIYRDVTLAPRISTRVGFFGGVSGGLLGGGTGIVTVPALAKHTNLPRSVINGTANMPNCAAAIMGSICYLVAGRPVDWTITLALIIGGFFGVYFAVKVLRLIPDFVLKMLFIALLVITAIKFLSEAANIFALQSQGILPYYWVHNIWCKFILSIFLGIIIGAWAASMGVGGGILSLPALTILFGYPVHWAAAISLCVMFPNTLVASFLHARHDTAVTSVGLPIAIWAIPGSAIGAMIGIFVSERILSFILGLYIVFVFSKQLIALYHPVSRVSHESEETAYMNK